MVFRTDIIFIEHVPTVLMFLAELVLTVLMFLAELVLTVLVFRTKVRSYCTD
jgi:hypothetical protein